MSVRVRVAENHQREKIKTTIKNMHKKIQNKNKKEKEIQTTQHIKSTRMTDQLLFRPGSLVGKARVVPTQANLFANSLLVAAVCTMQRQKNANTHR